MKAGLGMGGLAELLSEAARQLARTHPVFGGASFPERVHHLRDLLDELGVATRHWEEGEIQKLLLKNYLLTPEFSRYPETYAFHRALAEEVLGVEVEIELAADPRQGGCVLRFRKPAPTSGLTGSKTSKDKT